MSTINSSSKQGDVPYSLGNRCMCEVPGQLCGPCGDARDICVVSQDASSFGHRRYYSPRMFSIRDIDVDDNHRYDYGNGFNWVVSAWPYVTDGPTLVMPGRPSVVMEWDEQDGSYKQVSDLRFMYDKVANVFRVIMQDGSHWEFRGFRPGTHAKGRLKKVTWAPGHTTEVKGYTGAGHLSSIVTTFDNGETAFSEIYSYTYQECPDGGERLASLTVSRQQEGEVAQHQRRITYSYHGGFGSAGPDYDITTNPRPSGTTYGYTGDLESAIHEIHENGEWVAEGKQYYRYYTNSHALKFVVEPQQFEALQADPEVSDPLDVSDEKLAQYATRYFEYDENDEVTKMTSVGDRQSQLVSQLGTESESNTNAFKLKTIETKPDGSKRTLFTNYRGQVLLDEFQNCATGDKTYEFYRYDDDGNLTLHATPSALSGYTVSGYTITPTYKSSGGLYNVGLVHVYTYYDETDTDTGGHAVKGYKEYDKVKQGRDGTPINVRKYEYTEHSATVNLPGSEGTSSSSSSSGGDETIDITVYPVAKEIAYPNEDGSSPIETCYAYTWYFDSVQMQQRTTTLPAVSAAQNGSGTSATRVERFDEFGRLVWTKDERGTIAYKEYDLASGNVTQSIEDVDDTQLTVPSGWSTPSGGGKHLVTDFEYDHLDRLVQTLGPEHDVQGTTVRTASWTVYKTADRETRSAQGYAVSDGQGGYNYTLVNPVQIEKHNATGTRSESISAVRSSTSGKLTASDTFAQTDYTRWSVSLSNNAGQLTASRVYHTIPDSGDGSSGTNYDESTFGYDAMGRQNKSVTPGGTISRTVFDARGHAVADYVGTDDSGATDADPTGAGGDPHLVLCTGSSPSSSSSSSSGTEDPDNNMVLVSERDYCDGSSGCSCGGGGAGQLVSETRHVDALTWHTTDFEYDWRGRQLHVFPPADDAGRVVYSKTTHDNLDRATKQERYLEIAGADDRLLARSETFYDDRSRVYQTRRHAVNVDTGAVGNALVSNTWYDAAGNAIKQQSAGSQAFTKTVYDSLGRAVKQYLGHDTDETAYADASSVSDDTIVEQVETAYDDVGNVLQMTTRQRFHNATGTGELTTPSGSQPKARVAYVAMYHDEIGRQIAVANYGTYGGATFDRAGVVPSRTDTILVTSTEYNDAGQAYKTVDPAGREDRQVFDNAGRVVKTIQNYVDGVVSAAASDEDVTVEMTYNADGNLETLTAKNPTTGDQTTTYVYGTTLSDSEIATSTLKRAEIYPDSDDAPLLGDGTDGVFDRIEFCYDRQSQRTSKQDQNGSIHAYEYDAMGRMTHDRVTTVGSGVDGSVRRIGTEYEERGMVTRVTSYDAATDGNAVNEIVFEYDDSALLVKEYQEHCGAKDSNTPYIQYNRDTNATSGLFTKGLRCTSLRYPNGRLIHYTYGSSGSTADAMGRISAIKDDDSGSPGASLADYEYLGRQTIVCEDYPEPSVRLDYDFGTPGEYSGFDRFGRIIDQRWYDYGAGEVRDQYRYGYDRASNRLYRENTVASSKDEFYTYDGMNRLTTYNRGDLNSGKTAITGTPVREEDWSLDMTGNWSRFVQKTAGTTDLDQDRTHNAVNEITAIGAATGTNWATPVHDRAGNMTTIPKPSDLATSLTAKYDAWNRLVEVKAGATVVGEYQYDGRNRRVCRNHDSGAPASPTGVDTYVHYFCNATWQVLETRESDSAVAQPETIQPQSQYVWSERYIDAPVLRDKNTDQDSLCDDERVYFLGDANFNVTTLVDTNGDAVERCEYTPYANVTIFDGTWSTPRTTSSYANAVFYTGRELDPESGIYHIRMRCYHPDVGSFLTRDPVSYLDGMSVYAAHFVQKTLVDPSGLSAVKCCGVDVTDWLIGQINDHVTHESVVGHKRAIENSDRAMVNAWRALRRGDFAEAWRWFRESAKYERIRLEKAWDLVELVRIGGDWDFKNNALASKDIKCKDDCCTEQCAGSVTLCGQCVGNDVPGNIHFGTVFRAAGFSQFETIVGPGFVQEDDNWPFDDPADSAAINIGWFAMQNGRVSENALCNRVKANVARKRLRQPKGKGDCRICDSHITIE